MTTATDFLVQKTTNGYYDIIQNGQMFAKTAGLDTSLLVSLLTDKRASESEQLNSLLRRGYWGDIFVDYPYGSKLWISANSSLSNLSRNSIIDNVKNSLNWLIQENFADTINVEANVNLQAGSVSIIIKIIKDGNVTQRQFEILENT
jgi:phage gp46-like protein